MVRHLHQSRDRAELLEPVVYERANGQLWRAEVGLVFDGASIPQLFWSFSTNPWAADVLPAAVIHDQYCQYGKAGRSPYRSEEVHQTFYEILRCIGVTAWRARARWAAVRYFGPRFPATPS